MSLIIVFSRSSINNREVEKQCLCNDVIKLGAFLLASDRKVRAPLYFVLMQWHMHIKISGMEEGVKKIPPSVVGKLLPGAGTKT